MGAVQVRGEVLKVQRVGAYHQLTVVAPGIADSAKPGHFVAISVGGDDSAMLLRRAFSIYATSSTGVYGGTVEIVFAVHGRGTAWLAKQRPHDPLDVVGPLGTPFKLPKGPARCLLVGGGYGTAPLFGLASALKARGCRVDFVMGAASQDRLFGQLEAKRIATSLAVTTDDGSLGERGRVSDVLPQMIDRCGTEVVYACGPMAMLAAVSEISVAHGLPCQTAVEESMACGVGVCMTCVLPVRQKDGTSRLVRSCVEGPVFEGSTVRWADVGTLPADVVGAAAMGGH
ncbi:MAG: dihydroorotate dehydrogenase electron transfer subunit [Frankiaceae bacterium]|nr:dihydroorotate dehydrogenase electron transfer subunit [Frankiaceae bacterium]MDX6274796.1 dihydroorotate dehydrogenase electron transfer subunit [Frankiales bacterium]